MTLGGECLTSRVAVAGNQLFWRSATAAAYHKASTDGVLTLVGPEGTGYGTYITNSGEHVAEYGAYWAGWFVVGGAVEGGAHVMQRARIRYQKAQPGAEAPVRVIIEIPPDGTSAAGQTVWRHIPRDSVHRLPDAKQGLAIPRNQLDPRSLTADEIASMAAWHDQNLSQNSALTAWTANRRWAFERFERGGGVVLQLDAAPQGSIWWNAAAHGAECQVFVPGRVQAKVILSE